MAKQTFTTGNVLTAAQMNSLQQNDFNQTVNQKTASYVLVATDAGTRIEMNAAGATTITVNTGIFTAGDTVYIQNIGAGTCTVTAGTATVNKGTTVSLALSQYQGGYLYFISASSSVFFANDSGSATTVTQQTQAFTSTGTFTVPAGVSRIEVLLVGGGGGAGGIGAISGAVHAASGGGGGGGVNRQILTVTPSTSYTVTIGGGGSGGIGSSSTDSTNGSESSFGVLMYAGGGGRGGSNQFGTGAGGDGTGGGGGGAAGSSGGTLVLAGGSGGGGGGAPAGIQFYLDGAVTNQNSGGSGRYGGGSGSKLGGSGAACTSQISASSNATYGSMPGAGLFNYGIGGPGGAVTNGTSMFLPYGPAGGVEPFYRSNAGTTAGTSASANSGNGGGGCAIKSTTSTAAVTGGNGGSGYCLVTFWA